MITVSEILDLMENEDDVFIVDKDDGEILDCGLGCSSKYWNDTVVSVSLEHSHICLKIDILKE